MTAYQHVGQPYLHTEPPDECGGCTPIGGSISPAKDPCPRGLETDNWAHDFMTTVHYRRDETIQSVTSVCRRCGVKA